MKRPALLLALLLLALSCSDASLLARGRSRTKKNGDRVTSEAPHVCLDAPIDLPACTFNAEAGGETREKSSRQSRELSESFAELDSKDLSPIGDTQGKSRAIVIVYKIEGCIPTRLPFVLPICKEEDSIGRIVEVRRLFPFNLMGSSGYESDTTLVFPEVDMDQWNRFMHGPWTRPINSEDNANEDDEVNRELSQTKISKRKKVGLDSINEKKTMLRKLKKIEQLYGSRKIDENNIFSKFPSAETLQLRDDRASDTDSYKTRRNRLNRIDDSQRGDQQVVEKSSFAKYTEEFPYAKAIPYDPVKLQVARIDSEFPYNRAIPYDAEKLQIPRRGSEFPYARAIIYEPRISRSNGIFEDEQINVDANQRDEFPYAEAISYDPEKLGVARVGSEFPYNRAIPYDPVKLQYLQRAREYPYSKATPYEPIKNPLNEEIVEEEYNYAFPYAKAIPYDPKKLGVARVDSEFPYTRAIPYDKKKLKVAKVDSEFPYTRAIPYDKKKLGVDSEFPYTRAIPYDKKKLEVARIDSEFPYTRAIPYDPAKLQVATRGSEFPYAKAIPYDPKKLESRWSGIIDERSIPFYTRGLKASGVETKPFNSRVVPFDSSMLDAAKEGRIFPYSKAIPDDTSKNLDTMEFPKSRDSERIKVPVRHVKTFWNEEVPNYTRKLQIEKDERRIDNVLSRREVQKNIISTENEDYMNNLDSKKPMQARVTRSALGPDSSSDISSAHDNLEVPGQWSEFPYSKAIPFDPSKLRRPRSTMKHSSNPSNATPQDFPYAKAIPYDPSKLMAFRRKKYKSQEERTIFEESKLLGRLKRSSLD